MAQVCPAPPNLSSPNDISSAVFQSGTKISESTGESFSAESGYFLPTPSISAQMMDVSAGTFKPPPFAVFVGGFPPPGGVGGPVSRVQGTPHPALFGTGGEGGLG